MAMIGAGHRMIAMSLMRRQVMQQTAVHFSPFRTLVRLNTQSPVRMPGNDEQNPPPPPPPETWMAKTTRKLVKIGKELWYGSKLLWNNTMAANAIRKREKAGEAISRRELVFVRNNRVDLIRCIPILLIYKGIPIIHSAILPFYIYYARHMLPSTYHFFDEKSDEVKELKEENHLYKLLETDRPVEPWEAELMKILPMDRPWSRSEVLAALPKLLETCKIDNLTRRQMAAVCYALALHPTTLVPAFFLKPRLQKHFDFLNRDDAMLISEGIEGLTIAELREACQHRGISIWGESEYFLRTQLSVWLDVTQPEPRAGGSLCIYTHGFKVREMVLADDGDVQRVASLRAPEPA